jgi:predicted GIY-YIG superfamily endonuclease
MDIKRVYKIVNDVDDLIYIGATTQTLSRRMTEHRKKVKNGFDRKLHNHMRIIGVEHFKILLVREYTDISKEKLRKKEDKYIKKYDSVKNGLNMIYSYGHICIHNIKRDLCKECGGYSICIHNKLRHRCIECGGGAICNHNKRREHCKECSNCLCEHNNRLARCKICSPTTCDICNKIYSKEYLKAHMKYKHSN